MICSDDPAHFFLGLGTPLITDLIALILFIKIVKSPFISKLDKGLQTLLNGLAILMLLILMIASGLLIWNLPIFSANIDGHGQVERTN